jgi:hypothetical protein
MDLFPSSGYINCEWNILYMSKCNVQWINCGKINKLLKVFNKSLVFLSELGLEALEKRILLQYLSPKNGAFIQY